MTSFLDFKLKFFLCVHFTNTIKTSVAQAGTHLAQSYWLLRYGVVRSLVWLVLPVNSKNGLDVTDMKEESQLKDLKLRLMSQGQCSTLASFIVHVTSTCFSCWLPCGLVSVQNTSCVFAFVIQA